MASVQSTNKGKARKKRKPKLTADERKQRATERAFKRQVRGIFSKIGFKRIPEAADKEFEFQNRKSDFDDFFVKENLIVFTEYTLSNEKGWAITLKTKLISITLSNPIQPLFSILSWASFRRYNKQFRQSTITIS